ncbi:MAG: hypothetical protein LBI56_02385 [Puniceicoccales bacterium]|jgi:type III secretion protein C|nr:hypothetical protein [Puniceicoccales bacterium]
MKILKTFLAVALLSLYVPLVADADSQEPILPFSKASYYHFAKDQSLSALIQDFFAMQGIAVIVSDKINYTVNGRFNKMSPLDFWNYITKAYGLVWFFDGKIMYVYSNTELQTQIFRMDVDSIETLSIILARLGFVASDFSFRGVGEANVLIVTAPPQYLAVINDIADKFVPSKISDTTIVKIIPLKYAWAYDMTFNYANGSISVPGISSLLQSIVTGQQLAAAFSPFNVSVGGAGPSKQTQYQQMVGILDDTPPYAKDINNNIKSLKSNDAKKSADGDGTGKASSGESVADISGATLPGFITCDQRLNAVIIRDRHENMPFYEDIIAKLDIPCEIIKIDVAVVDVSKSAGKDLGVKGLGVAIPGKSINLGISTMDSILSAQASGTPNVGSGSMSGHLGIVKNLDINFALDALERNGSGQAMSKPSVLTLDNVAAILETDKVHYETVAGTNNSNAYTQTATTKLQVVPHIIPGDVDANGKRKIKLFVDISDGSFEANSAGQVTQHSLNTQAILYEGQSLLIGGYNTETNKKVDKGVPVLCNLPLVGSLFRHSEDQKEIKERVYVISPSVVEIRSDDRTYDRFIQPGNLSAESSLQPNEYSLSAEWPPQKVSVHESIIKGKRLGNNKKQKHNRKKNDQNQSGDINSQNFSGERGPTLQSEILPEQIEYQGLQSSPAQPEISTLQFEEFIENPDMENSERSSDDLQNFSDKNAGQNFSIPLDKNTDDDSQNFSEEYDSTLQSEILPEQIEFQDSQSSPAQPEI